MNNIDVNTQSSSANPDSKVHDSEVEQAIEKVQPIAIEQNLDEEGQVGQSEDLSEQEETPFIDDDLRTDK